MEHEQETNRALQIYRDSAGISGGQKVKLSITVLLAALAHQCECERQEEEKGQRSFRFVLLDEAFVESDDDNTQETSPRPWGSSRLLMNRG